MPGGGQLEPERSVRKAGFDSLSASEKFWNCAGANCSKASAFRASPPPVTTIDTRFTSFGFWVPILSSFRSSGSARCEMRRMPTGCRISRRFRGRHLAQRHEQIGSSGGSSACQFSALSQLAREERQHRDRRQLGVAALAPRHLEIDVDIPEEQRDRAVALDVPRRRPFERPRMLTENSPMPKTLTESDAEISMMK